MNDIVSLKYIPTELKYNGLWCYWKLCETGKVPINVITGKLAKSNDPSTFVTYPILLNNIHKYLLEDKKSGLGLGIFKGFSAIDIDHCIDENGHISEMAEDIISQAKSYTEISPSGTGIRIIFKTSVKINKDEFYIQNHKLGLEIYISDNTNKFVTITGNIYRSDLNQIREFDITDILNKYMQKPDIKKSKPDISKFNHDEVINLNLEQIFEKDSKLKELWFSKAPGSGADENQRDASLCCKLSYYLKGNVHEIERYFKMSPYYESKDELHKKKWERPDYVASTINGALSIVGPVLVDVKKYELNDTGNAHKFVEMFGDILRYNTDNDIWMIWNGKYWQYDISKSVKNYVEILAEKMLYDCNNEFDLNTKQKMIKNLEHIYSSSGKNNLLEEAKHLPGIPVTNEMFDKDPYLLCTESGVINLKTQEIQEFNKEDMISNTTTFEIDTENKPKLFEKFLMELCNNNKELFHFLHKAFGYSITNSTREQKMFILKGDGNNGKSLLLDVVKTCIGAYGITCKPQFLTEQNFGTNNTEEVARLKGKRMAVIEEIKAGDKMDEQLVKSYTSGIGNQVARFLYGHNFEFLLTCKLWMATNYEPIIRGIDKGIWRRICLIPIEVDFTGREDKDLREKLLKEAPQILGWLLEGYKLYMKEGLDEPEIVKNATDNYRQESDIVAQWISECCEVNPNYFERSSILFENHNYYCKQRELKTNITIFGRNMAKKFRKERYPEGIVYIGLRIRKDQANLKKKVIYDNVNVEKDY